MEKLKLESKKYDATVTQYLTAVLIYSIYNANYRKSNKPIKICVPVNLKKYFPSQTMSNFFSYITITAKVKTLDNFDQIIKLVKNEFTSKLTEKELLKTMSSNVRLGTNLFIKTIPLFLKNMNPHVFSVEIQKNY